MHTELGNILSNRYESDNRATRFPAVSLATSTLSATSTTVVKVEQAIHCSQRDGTWKRTHHIFLPDVPSLARAYSPLLSQPPPHMTRAVGAGPTPLVVVVLPCWSTCVRHKSQEAAQVRDMSPLEFKSFRWASSLRNLEFRSMISNSRASILLWKKLLSAIGKGGKEIVQTS